MPTRGETLAALRHAIEAHTPGLIGRVSDDDLWNEVVSRRPDVVDKITPDAPQDRGSGMLESAIGTALTMGGAKLLGADKEVGRGAMDASARMVNNVGKLTGLQTPERASEINAQLQPQGAGETIGQAAPSLALAAAVPGAQGLAGAGLDALASGGITALDTGDPTKALEAGAGGAALGAVGPVVAKLTPAMKLKHVSALTALLKGGVGAGVAAYQGGARGAIEGALTTALLEKFGISDVSKSATTKLQQAARSGNDSTIARILWRLLPPAVAHATGQEQSFEDARNSLAPTDTKSLAALAKRRLEAQSVIR